MRTKSVTAAELVRYERLKRRGAENLVVGNLPDDVVRAIKAAEYGKTPRPNHSLTTPTRIRVGL